MINNAKDVMTRARALLKGCEVVGPTLWLLKGSKADAPVEDQGAKPLEGLGY